MTAPTMREIAENIMFQNYPSVRWKRKAEKAIDAIEAALTQIRERTLDEAASLFNFPHESNLKERILKLKGKA